MSKYTFKLTEEISRWAFEVHVREFCDWDIVFTNPTAGPWKRLEATNNEGARGEVYRFDRDEERPDIVMVNDALEAILIFEAKDSLTKLMTESQVKKSCNVVGSMAKVLSGQELASNPFWGMKSRYSIYNALLWGENNESPRKTIDEMFSAYHQHLLEFGDYVDTSFMLGIETRKQENNALRLIPYKYGESGIAQRITMSLNLNLQQGL